MRRLLVFSSVVLLFCLPVAMNAQSASSATITGQVVDPQGAVVVGAKVTATNVATGIGRSANTTGSGDYTIPNLPPGTYDVKVEADKFATGESKGFKLNVGDQRDLNFKMTVAGSAQTVEVTTQAPLIETTKTEVSTSVTDVQMQQLPTFAAITGGANDYASLALTAPGVKMDTSTLTGDQQLQRGIRAGRRIDNQRRNQVRHQPVPWRWPHVLPRKEHGGIQSVLQPWLVSIGTSAISPFKHCFALSGRGFSAADWPWFRRNLDQTRRLRPGPFPSQGRRIYDWRPVHQEQAVLLRQL